MHCAHFSQYWWRAHLWGWVISNVGQYADVARAGNRKAELSFLSTYAGNISGVGFQTGVQTSHQSFGW